MTTNSKRILVIDPQIAGVSGDMMAGALLDLGADPSRVSEAMTAPAHHLKGCKDIAVTIKDTTKNGIRAKMVDIQIEEEASAITAGDLLDAAALCLEGLHISNKAKEYVLAAMNRLISAEETIHKQDSSEIHLHELASADTLADIIGTATALDDLNIFKNTGIYSTPVALGGGTINVAHGTLPCPAPTTLEILRSEGLFTAGGPIDAELTTPTGAALLSALTPECIRFYPSMRPFSVGYGAGSKVYSGFANILRITLGEPYETGLLRDEIYMLETNLDDTTGELIGYTIKKLLLEGARDAVSIPTVNKKGRPGHLISVITDGTNLERLCSVLIKETGSLGVRTYPCQRRILSRESVPVEITLDDLKHVVNVKIARDTDGRIIRIKPEYDDIKILARQSGRPLREIEELVTREAIDAL